ncbi:MAG: phosphoribosylformylglycinamidine synthase I [Anaerolineales bacterium]|nr:phosphoribosylformylglycinamidine synthase I [Anaerolineales bacterium]
MKPRALVLLAHGTNRDQDAAEALTLAGAQPEIVPLNILRDGRKRFDAYQMLVLPGGFSYADALGAGRLLAIDLNAYFGDQVGAFVESGKPVIGICNGFQALVKAGILPGVPLAGRRSATADQKRKATLTFNANGRFECRWVILKPVSQACLWTNSLTELIACPVAHGEGNFQTSDATFPQEQIVLTYVHPGGSPAQGAYPANPNGSLLDIAGITNPGGNVLGLMPHPENHIHSWQSPQRTRGLEGMRGLSLFERGVMVASQL